MLLGCQSARQDDYDEIFQAQNIDYLFNSTLWTEEKLGYFSYFSQKIKFSKHTCLCMYLSPKQKK